MNKYNYLSSSNKNSYKTVKSLKNFFDEDEKTIKKDSKTTIKFGLENLDYLKEIPDCPTKKPNIKNIDIVHEYYKNPTKPISPTKNKPNIKNEDHKNYEFRSRIENNGNIVPEYYKTPTKPMNADAVKTPVREITVIPEFYVKNENKNEDKNNVEKNDNKNSTDNNTLKIEWVYNNNAVLSSPETFGPAQWFTYHNGAANYPVNPPSLTKERMKNFILGIPVMIPCAKCKEHATAFIENHFDKLDEIVENRTNLFNFFVDFHNYVNKRYNKKIFTHEEAWKLYTEKGQVKIMKYS